MGAGGFVTVDEGVTQNRERVGCEKNFFQSKIPKASVPPQWEGNCGDP